GNAIVATGVPAVEWGKQFDTISVCFSKGLGAPVGSALAGPAEFITRARRYRKIFGGAMRQAGICAAACLYALDHHVDRLAEDHQNAKALVRGLRQMPGVAVEDPETNLVFFDPAGAGIESAELIRRLRAKGVHLSLSAGRIRAR